MSGQSWLSVFWLRPHIRSWLVSSDVNSMYPLPDRIDCEDVAPELPHIDSAVFVKLPPEAEPPTMFVHWTGSVDLSVPALTVIEANAEAVAPKLSVTVRRAVKTPAAAYTCCGAL